MESTDLSKLVVAYQVKNTRQVIRVLMILHFSERHGTCLHMDVDYALLELDFDLNLPLPVINYLKGSHVNSLDPTLRLSPPLHHFHTPQRIVHSSGRSDSSLSGLSIGKLLAVAARWLSTTKSLQVSTSSTFITALRRAGLPLGQRVAESGVPNAAAVPDGAGGGAAPVDLRRGSGPGGGAEGGDESNDGELHVD